MPEAVERPIAVCRQSEAPVPRALSWMCLFPAESNYIGLSVPAEFEPWVPRQEIDREDSVLVAWQQNRDALPDVSKLEGLAAVNCRGLRDHDLRKAGFDYIRRFAILPSLENPRWFIPLDRPSVSAAAFGLYSPVRASARVRQLAARLAARSGLRFWYRDQVCIAGRRVPPLESLLQDALDRPSLRLAISTGNVAPVRNLKRSLAILDRDGQVLGFGKLSTTKVARHRVQHEARMLRHFQSLPGGPRVPTMLFAGEVDDASLLVSSPLAGRAVNASLSPLHRRFLNALQHGPAKSALATGLMTSLRQRAWRQRETLPELPAMMEAISRVLEPLQFPTTVMHRDFTPWNLRRQREELAAFDWEYAETDGLPLVDQFHHDLAVGYFLKRWTPKQACHHLRHIASSATARLSPQPMGVLQIVALIDHLLVLLDEGYAADYPKAAWWREVLTQRWRSLKLNHDDTSHTARESLAQGVDR